MNRSVANSLFLLAVCLLAAAGCQTADPLPTVAPSAFVPPTPPVVIPTPTAARGAGDQGGGGTGEEPSPATTTATVTVEPTGGTPAPSVPTPPVTPAVAAPLPANDCAAPPCSPAAPLPCAEAGRIEQGALDSAVAGEPMRYRVYLPPCYEQDGRAYPTLYLFGGNIHDDGIWDALGMDEAAEAAINAGRIAPLLIVMPDNGWLANTTTSGPDSYEGFVLNELIPTIESRYCAWPAAEGRAVGGLSRGGYWSLMMAFRRPDLFRSVGAHSPALIDEFAGAAEDPAVTGVVNDLGDLRIWVDIGQRDPYLAQARPLHEALAADGVAHEWRVNPGQHDNAYWQAHLSDYLDWYSAGFPPDRAALPLCER